MSNLSELHQAAMEIADQAFMIRRAEGHEQARPLFARAYQMELDAAHLATKEPSRSILHRSAATLALHAELLREAEVAAALGLAGNPPPEIAHELHEVFERINFRRHLSLQGVVLNPNELQLALTGNAVSEGMALLDAVFSRVQNLEKLIIRTAQRLNNKPFATLSKSEMYSVYMSQPRTGSFAVTLRIGQPEQQVMQELDNRPQVIDEVIYNLDLVNENRTDDLRLVIKDQSYFESFLGLAKHIAPDGDAVRMVGVTTFRENTERSVGLSITSRQIKPAVRETIETLGDRTIEGLDRPTSITGELLHADAIKKNIVKVVDDTGKTHVIHVSDAIAEDVVKPFFGSRVTVEFTRSGRKLMYRDIYKV